MRRVNWVRVRTDHGVVRCEVVGIGHRIPAVRPIGLATASALAADGVPVVFRTVDSTAAAVAGAVGS